MAGHQPCIAPVMETVIVLIIITTLAVDGVQRGFGGSVDN
jgi:hypothetical protein